MNKEKMIELLMEGNISVPKLLLNNYAKLGLTEEEFMLLIHVYSFIEGGNSFPTPFEISEKMSISDSRCTEILRYLLKKGFISIKEEHDEHNIIYENYTLKPLWDILLDLFIASNKKEALETQKQEEINVYTIFEQEFGRPLSPFECESLAMWLDLDHHDPIIIKAALREAVLSGKLNFRYIDRILFEWKKNGIRTIEQAQLHSKKFRQHSKKQKSENDDTEEYKRTVPFYNWLEQK